MVFGWLNNSNPGFKYKERNSSDRRKSEAQRARRKRPDLVPVILEKALGDKAIDLPNHKFLIPGEMTLREFQLLIRKKIHLKNENSLFFFLNGNTLMSMSQTMHSVYEQNHEEDFFLYITYGQESTFGG